MKPAPDILSPDLPAAQSEPYTDAEISMILDTYMYTNYEYAEDGQELRSIVDGMPERIDTDETYYKEYEILRKAVRDPEIGSLRICGQSRKMGYDSGTNACTFVNEDKSKAYVAFRGTADGEWLDNGLGLTERETKQQKQALSYFDEVVEKEGLDENTTVTITGHSKGANKVQYIAMESANAFLITKCYAVDGQGFSKKAIEGWKEKYGEEEYQRRTEKLYGINGQNDYVSVLGTCIIPASHIRYVETPAERKDMAAYHDITRMFATGRRDEDGTYRLTFHGRKNQDVLERGTLGSYVRGLSDELMKLPGFVLDGCAASIMQLAESLGGGRHIGVNGEVVKLLDLAEFQRFGLPTILYSLLMKKDGASLLENVCLQEDFSVALTANDDISINYRMLDALSGELRMMAGALETRLFELEAAGFALPFYIDGITIRKHQIDTGVARLKLVQMKLLALSAIGEGIAKLFEACDASIAEALNL